MLAMTDTPIEQFLPLFAQAGVAVSFLVPTPNGYQKSIMDATAPVRDLLLKSNVHDYEAQRQGPNAKARIPAHFVNNNFLTDTFASLYRPITKQGDPRIWFQNLKRYCAPRNLLALIIIKGEIYVYNLSDAAISARFFTAALHMMFCKRPPTMKIPLQTNCWISFAIFIIRGFCVPLPPAIRASVTLWSMHWA